MKRVLLAVAACVLVVACNRAENKEGPPPNPPTPPTPPVPAAPVEGMAKINPNAKFARWLHHQLLSEVELGDRGEWTGLRPSL